MNTSEAELSDDTSPIGKEEVANDRKDYRNKNMMRIKKKNDQMKFLLLWWRKVSVI